MGFYTVDIIKSEYMQAHVVADTHSDALVISKELITPEMVDDGWELDAIYGPFPGSPPEPPNRFVGD